MKAFELSCLCSPRKGNDEHEKFDSDIIKNCLPGGSELVFSSLCGCRHRPHVGLTAGVGFFFALNRVTTGNRFGGPLAKERRNAWRTRTALLKSCGRPLFGQAQGVTIVCEKRLASVWQPLGVVVQTRSDRPIYGLRQCDSPPDLSQGVVSLALSLCRFASKGNDL